MFFRAPPEKKLTANQCVTSIETILQAFQFSKLMAFIREIERAIQQGCVFTSADKQWLRKDILFVKTKLTELETKKAQMTEALYNYEIKETDQVIAANHFVSFADELMQPALEIRKNVLALLEEKKFQLLNYIEIQNTKNFRECCAFTIPEEVEASRRVNAKIAKLVSPLLSIFVLNIELESYHYIGLMMLVASMHFLKSHLIMKELDKTLKSTKALMEILSDAKYENMHEEQVLVQLSKKLNTIAGDIPPAQQAQKPVEQRLSM